MLDVIVALFFLAGVRLFFTVFRSMIDDAGKVLIEAFEEIERRRRGPPSTSLALPVPVRWEMDDEQKATAALHAKVRDLELQVALLPPLRPLPPPACRHYNSPMVARCSCTPSTLAPAAFDVVPSSPVVRRPPPLPAPVGSTTICR